MPPLTPMASATDTKLPLPETAAPHDRLAERSVIGALLVAPDLIAEVAEHLLPEDFYFPDHQAAFAAVRHLFDTHRPVDVVTVKSELERRGALETAGGFDALTEMAADVPGAAGAVEYAQTVKDHARRRRMIQVCLQGIRDARTEGAAVDEALAQAQQDILNISDAHDRTRARPLQEYLLDVCRIIYAASDRQTRLSGLSTGLFELDDKINGLQPGHLYIVAGRPSMGKTSLALRIAEHVALEQGVPTAMFSLEMAGKLLTQVMLCAHCHVSMQNIQKGFLTTAERDKLLRAAGTFENAPLYIDDASDTTILQLRMRARRLKAQYDIGLVVIDYLQLLHTGESVESRQVEISQISRQMKSMAKELSVPVIGLAQLNREAEKREDHKPRLADLRESGSLEQDADVVMLLFREAAYKGGEEDGDNIAEIIVAKNRTGPIGSVQATFLKEFMRFEPISFHYAGKVVR